MLSEVDFISPCPVEGCKNKETKIRWCHHNCGGYERITNQGKIYCLRCNTEGRGTYQMTFDHYEEVPRSIAEDIIKKNGVQ